MGHSARRALTTEFPPHARTLAGRKQLPALRNAEEIGITLSEEGEFDP